jgi:hypothetical protein
LSSTPHFKNRLSREKNQPTSGLKFTTDKMDLTAINRVFHPRAAHGVFSKIDHILGYKAKLNK